MKKLYIKARGQSGFISCIPTCFYLLLFWWIPSGAPPHIHVSSGYSVWICVSSLCAVFSCVTLLATRKLFVRLLLLRLSLMKYSWKFHPEQRKDLNINYMLFRDYYKAWIQNNTVALGSFLITYSNDAPCMFRPTRVVILMCDSFGLNSRLGNDSLQARRTNDRSTHVSTNLPDSDSARDISVCVWITEWMTGMSFKKLRLYDLSFHACFVLLWLLDDTDLVKVLWTIIWSPSGEWARWIHILYAGKASTYKIPTHLFWCYK